MHPYLARCVVTGVVGVTLAAIGTALTPDNAIPSPPASPYLATVSNSPTVTANAAGAITRVDAQPALRAATTRSVAAQRASRSKARLREARTASTWVWPVSSVSLGARFGASGGNWSSGQHTGQDFDGETGDAVRAVTSGVVIFAESLGRRGIVVQLRHKGGIETWYCHLSKVDVAVGDTVTTGQRVGRIGTTGNVTGSHLHFELHTSPKVAVNPMPWFKRNGLGN